ncbi:MAG: hypothetical protein LBC19_05905 [Tannerella sp.]|jgi:hypothetical protein|nr:hypothetical protein [Tannerella sp.]
MRRLFFLPAVSALTLLSFAQVDLKNSWDEAMKAAQNTTFSSGNYDLFGMGLGGLVNDFDFSLLPGGMKALDFGEGGLLSNLFGGIFGAELMDAMGMEELHNDASLNNNVTWGIVMTTKLMSPHIHERQRKIMSLQDSINLKVKQLYELELLTVKYMSQKQSDAVDIEDEENFVKLAEDIAYFYGACSNLCDAGGAGLDGTKTALAVQLLTRSTRIALKVYDFAKKDGTKNLLHNQDRDELITYVYENLREMRGIVANACRELNAGVHYNDLYK